MLSLYSELNCFAFRVHHSALLGCPPLPRSQCSSSRSPSCLSSAPYGPPCFFITRSIACHGSRCASRGFSGWKSAIASPVASSEKAGSATWVHVSSSEHTLLYSSCASGWSSRKTESSFIPIAMSLSTIRRIHFCSTAVVWS